MSGIKTTTNHGWLPGWLPDGLHGWLLLGGIMFCTLLAGLGSSRLWDRDEPRNARCAAEMLSADDWVTPRFNDQLRTHKPVLLYWLQMAAYQVVGNNAWGARLPSALLSCLTIGIMGILAARAVDGRTGFWVAAALASSLMFVVAGRAATPDAGLIFGSTCGIACLAWPMLARPSPARHCLPRHCLPRGQFYLIGNLTDRSVMGLGYVALGLAVLAKGPVGLVLPMAVVAVWIHLELHRELARKVCIGPDGDAGVPKTPVPGSPGTWNLLWRGVVGSLLDWLSDVMAYSGTIKRLKIALGLVLVVLVALPWYCWVGYRTQGAWLHGFFFEHNLGRAIQSMEGHRGGPAFYPLAAMIGLFPWSLVAIPIGLWAWRGWDGAHGPGRLIRLGTIWMAVYLGAFSLASTKLPSYITPCYPGAALMIGGCMADWSSGRYRTPRWLLGLAAAVLTVAFLGMSLALPLAGTQLEMPSLRWHAWLGAGFLLAACLAWLAMRWNDQRRIPGGILVAGVISIGGAFAIVAPQVDRYRGDLHALLSLPSLPAGALAENGGAWLAIGTIEPSWIYYLNAPIREISATDPVVPGRWAREVAADHLTKKGNRLIVSTDQWDDLHSCLRQQGIRFVEVARFDRFLRNQKMVVVEAQAAPL